MRVELFRDSSGAHAGIPVKRRRRPPAWTLAAGVAVLLVPAGYALSRTPPCSADDTFTLRLVAAPEIAPVVKGLAAELKGCADVSVTAERSEDVVRRLRPGGAAGRPDVWLPDSALWAARLGRTGDSVAWTPVTVAATAKLAASRPGWRQLLTGKTKAAVPDPARSSAGAQLLAFGRQALPGEKPSKVAVTAFAQRLSERTVRDPAVLLTVTPRPEAVILPEQALRRYNGSHSDQITGYYPREGVPVLDYPFTVFTSDPARREAAGRLRSLLGSPEAAEALRREGFRTAPDPELPPVLRLPPERDTDTDLAMWIRLTAGIRLLTLIDVSGSMASVAAPGVTRLEATAALSRNGLKLFPEGTEDGLWVFATRLDGSRDWRELVDVGPLDADRQDRFATALAGLKAVPAGGTGLYDSVLAGVRHLAGMYRPDLRSTVLVLTDGRNDDPGGPSLKETVAKLRAERDPGRPVKVIILGLGPGVDLAELRSLVAPVNGLAFAVRSPAEAGALLTKAMSHRL